jgi:hypothetical protein
MVLFNRLVTVGNLCLIAGAAHAFQPPGSKGLFGPSSPDTPTTIGPEQHRGDTSYADILEASGFSVVSHDQLPKDYTVQPLPPVEIPASWVPPVPEVSKTSVGESASSGLLGQNLKSEAVASGVWDLPGIAQAIEKLGIAESGGSMIPVVFRQNPKAGGLLFEFSLLFTLWDDAIVERDHSLGRASVKRLEHLVQLCLIAPTTDDGEDVGAAIHRLVNEDERDAPFLRWWVSFFQRVAALPNLQSSRFVTCFCLFCGAFQAELDSLDHKAQESNNNMNNMPMDLEDAWHNRIGTGGGVVMCPLLSAAANFEPRPAFWDQREVRQMEFCFGAIMSQVNELSSIPKDIHDEIENLFSATITTTLHNNHNMSVVEDTIGYFVDLLSKTMLEFDHLEAQLRSREDSYCPEGASEYFDLLRKSAVILIQWHLKDERYTKIRLVKPQEKLAFAFHAKVLDG